MGMLSGLLEHQSCGTCHLQAPEQFPQKKPSTQEPAHRVKQRHFSPQKRCCCCSFQVCLCGSAGTWFSRYVDDCYF